MNYESQWSQSCLHDLKQKCKDTPGFWFDAWQESLYNNKVEVVTFTFAHASGEQTEASFTAEALKYMYHPLYNNPGCTVENIQKCIVDQLPSKPEEVWFQTQDR